MIIKLFNNKNKLNKGGQDAFKKTNQKNNL